MVKKAIFAFKKATKIMGLLLVVFLIYSFYDPSIFSSHQFSLLILFLKQHLLLHHTLIR